MSRLQTYNFKKPNLSKLIVIEPSLDISENVNGEDKLDSTSRNEVQIDDTEMKSTYVDKFKQEIFQANGQ